MQNARQQLHGLYLVTDDAPRLVERVALALEGGARVVQYRRKSGDPGERLDTGRRLKALCAARGVPFIVNDEIELAAVLDADGVHLGQEDGDPREARQTLGERKLIGISTHDVAEALAAEAAGADYIGVGAMHPSSSKDVTQVAGIAGLREIRKRVGLPLVAIGGIQRDNAGEIIDAGADAVAVISAVLSSLRPDAAAAELSLLFNRKQPAPRGAVLSVAGSDPAGGAGMQGDIKTVTLLGSYAAGAVTALTIQNTLGVTGVHPVPPEVVAAQMESVLSDVPIDVIKTGMLFSRDVVSAVAAAIRRFRKKIVVVDPVLSAKGGAELLQPAGLEALRSELFPLAYLITPNIPEAEALTGMRIGTEEEMRDAAVRLHACGAANVLLKGGHLPDGDAVDILYDGRSFTRFASPRAHAVHTHGTGCALASAISAYLAGGEPLPSAVEHGKDFVTRAILTGLPIGSGVGPVNHLRAARSVCEIQD